MASGLASLTANYTDSEEEEDETTEEVPSALKLGLKPEDESRIRDAARPGSGTPSSSLAGSTSASARSTPTKKMRLVSYNEEGDNDEDEDEGEATGGDSDKGQGARGRGADSDDADVISMDLDSENDGGSVEEQEGNKGDLDKGEEQDEENAANISQGSVKVDSWSGGIQLPPEPKGECDSHLQDSITKLYRRKMEHGYDLNAVIQQRKGFRNPSIYEKLIQFCEIDEMGTNFPPELYDGHLFGKESYYDELAKVQAQDMERREKAEKKRSAVDPSSVAAATTSHPQHYPSSSSSAPKKDDKQRRSRFDIGAASADNTKQTGNQRRRISIKHKIS